MSSSRIALLSFDAAAVPEWQAQATRYSLSLVIQVDFVYKTWKFVVQSINESIA